MFDENGNPIGGEAGMGQDPMMGGAPGGGMEFDPNMMGGEMQPGMEQMDPNMMGGEMGGGQESPWAWAEQSGVDPGAVQKTWENFTQNSQSLAEEKRMLDKQKADMSQLMELRDEIVNNPELAEWIGRFYTEDKKSDPSLQYDYLKKELDGMKFQNQLQKDMSDLRDYISKNDLPKVDENKVMDHMINNGLPTPMAAYRDMTYEDFGKSAGEKALQNIKKNQARIPGATPTGADTGGIGKKRMTANDISKMSPEDFNKNYGDLLQSFAR